jgi:hypothetical protein
MKINWIKFWLVVLLAILFSCSHFLIKDLSVQLIAKNIDEFGISDLEIVPNKQEPLTQKGAVVDFSFVPKRDDVSGVILYGRKHKYLFGENLATLTMKINYQKENGENFYLENIIPVSSLRGTIFSINFQPLLDCKDRTVNIEIIANQNLEEATGLAIYNQGIETTPKILYEINLEEELKISYENIKNDRYFFYFYFGLISLLLLAVISLFVIDPKPIDV